MQTQGIVHIQTWSPSTVPWTENNIVPTKQKLALLYSLTQLLQFTYTEPLKRHEILYIPRYFVYSPIDFLARLIHSLVVRVLTPPRLAGGDWRGAASILRHLLEPLSLLT